MPETPRYEPELLHELKNHLSVVVGFAELLLDEFPDDDPRRADMEQIQTAAAAAMALLPALGGQPRD
jgi:signal transduction histidine kinase